MRYVLADREEIVRRSFVEQAQLCESFGSPFTAAVIAAVEQVLNRSTDTGRTVLDWPGPPAAAGDALALRLASGLHALARSGSAELAELYPPYPPPAVAQLRERLAAAIKTHDAWLRPWLDQAPQTNEVGRSAALFAGLMTITARTRLPLRVFEIGSSAGLNLVLDRFGYRFGGLAAGDTDSPLTLAPDWSGPLPPAAKVEVSERRGCDLAPIDLSQPANRRRLEAYVWPDQQERHRRLSVATDLLLQDPPAIDRADAADWVRRWITDELPAGRTTVLMHSLTFTYLPPAAKIAIANHLDRIGATATHETPLAWLAYELDDANQPQLTLHFWPGGHRELLAEGHPHVRELRWLAV